MAHDIDAMDTKLRTIERHLDTLADGRFPQQLIPIIRRPGFTTVAEGMLIHAMLDHVQRQTEALHRTCENLLAAARDRAQPRADVLGGGTFVHGETFLCTTPMSIRPITPAAPGAPPPR